MELDNINEILKKKFGKKVKLKIIDQKKSFIQRKLSSNLPRFVNQYRRTN